MARPLSAPQGRLWLGRWRDGDSPGNQPEGLPVKSTLQERSGPLLVDERLWLYRAQESTRAHTFAEDVRAGLTATPKRLSPKYLYDDLGSTLFEAICLLPEYYLTRAETRDPHRPRGSDARCVRRTARTGRTRQRQRGQDAAVDRAGVAAAGATGLSSDRHLAERARLLGDAPHRRLRRADRQGARRRLLRGARERRARHATNGSSRCSSAQTSATTNRRRPRRCCARSPARCAPATGCCSAPTSRRTPRRSSARTTTRSG